MNVIIEVLFPMLCNKKADKILREKITNYSKDNTDDIFDDDVEMSKQDYEKLYEETMRTKSAFEDKAKANIIGVTITVSLITGSISLFERINKTFMNEWIQWITFGLYVMAVVYMLYAGIQAIRILCNDNIVFTEPMLGTNITQKQLQEKYGETIFKNRIQNLIRNNGVYTSYECIRNALVCLLFVLIVAVFPYNQTIHNKSVGTIKHTYAYSDAVANLIEEENLEYDVISIIEDNISNDNNDKINILVDEEHSIAIRFLVSDDVISILDIEKCMIK